MLIALVDIANLLLSDPHLDHHRPGDPELAARLQRAQHQLAGRAHLRAGARPDHRAALPADPPAAARFRRPRFLAAGDPDPDPGASRSCSPASSPHIITAHEREADRRKSGGTARSGSGSPSWCPNSSAKHRPRRRASPPSSSAKTRRARSMSARRTGRPPKPAWRASPTTCPTRSARTSCSQLVDRPQRR